MSAAPVSVVLAVVTFRRPDDLAQLLPRLLEQAAGPLAAEPGVRARVLVVDNDVVAGAGSSWPVVEPHAAAVQYELEPTPGIAAARNRALTAALAAGDDLLVFIDDDERPVADWPVGLVRTWRDTGAGAVCGPVRSELPPDADPWIVAGEFFARRHRAGFHTGRQIASAATNNMLLDLAQVRRLGLHFDHAFGTSGGEDELFSRRLTAGGARITWCAEALVDEIVRPDRVDRRWLLLRTFSYGSIDARIALTLAGSPAARTVARVRAVGSGLARIGFGTLRWAYGRLRRSLRQDSFGTQTLVRGCGLVGGALGFSIDRYRRPTRASSTSRPTADRDREERVGP